MPDSKANGLPSTAKNWKRAIDSLLERKHVAERILRTEEARIASLQSSLDLLTESRVHIQHVASEVQTQVHSRVASLVSQCLKAVFGDDAYTLSIEFERKRGRTEARLSLSRDGKKYGMIEGGQMDVASFALRLSALLLERPVRRKLLVLDEPFRFVSSEYRPAVRDLLESLSKELGVQIIMVTHARTLVAGEVIDLGGGV